MPRPTSKQELLAASEANYKRLLDLIDSYSADEVNTEFAPGTLNRNIKDVLAHLHEWHLIMQGWYKTGMAGEKPAMPAEGYTWKTLPEFNREVWKKHKEMAYDVAKASFQQSHQQIQQIISSHTDKELFEKKRYKWTGSTSLGAYLISNTSSHYDWAFKLIKKGMK
ncbi:ClbS/DfsB family four-helix bundle protein [Roseivirga misakiensis]|uniref:ClbS/DfsB family four-helix bundle protein n=1 Tax=Roseivirga misakiensis TaxID=1563681 RepID=A0A1E5SYQ4_9BACT|nr:ClbS/DfsB family four-helix bundle protein [Roseivirga misakiensis]OEK04246.1 hypothetical protein BFP71_12240 [Roseivirga misakiensis]